MNPACAVSARRGQRGAVTSARARLLDEREADKRGKRMKKSRAETAETRKRIVQVAAQEFRRNGIEQTGVADVMAAAGLTQGGFYRHFDSKDQLIAEACAASMNDLVRAAETAVEAGDEGFLKHLEHFLSCKHRDDWLGGCPLVFIGSELARADKDARHAAAQGFNELVDLLARLNRHDDAATAKAEAIFTLAAMIGAVSISRIVDDPQLSALILEETKKQLTKVRSKVAPKERRAPRRAEPK
jgi:TetR/AcrR family transcriptional regulator, transcriptional repressor for nem operon